MTDRPSKKRVTAKQCVQCKTLLSRDLSAACIILYIFQEPAQPFYSEASTVYYRGNKREIDRIDHPIDMYQQHMVSHFGMCNSIDAFTRILNLG